MFVFVLGFCRSDCRKQTLRASFVAHCAIPRSYTFMDFTFKKFTLPRRGALSLGIPKQRHVRHAMPSQSWSFCVRLFDNIPPPKHPMRPIPFRQRHSCAMPRSSQTHTRRVCAMRSFTFALRFVVRSVCAGKGAPHALA